jgi:hypothetical protein
MKVIRPVTIVDATLQASSVAEPDTGESAWSSGTSYALDAIVYLASTHRRYKSKQASNLNHNPATDTTATYWLDIGGTNRWSMFDPYVSTSTVESAAGVDLVVTVKPGVIDSLFLYGLVGDTATVELRDGLGGTLVYTRDLTLLQPKINDWYAYFFEPYRQVPYFVLLDVPPYANGHLTLTVRNATAAPACGLMVPGRTFYVGQTQYGAAVGIRDYSRKVVDADTGFTTLEQRKFAKTLRAQVRLFSSTYAEVHSILETLRATPVVWVADDAGTIEPLTLFGWYKDFSLTVDLPSGGVYGLDIEGMV